MKFLWRANVAGIAKPIYLVAQNMQSATAQASKNDQVQVQDVFNMQRIAEWNEQENRTKVIWPEPPPPPEPEPEPSP